MLNTGLSIYHKITFSDLVEFSKMAKQMGAKELISFGGYKPILVYYSRMPVDFTDKKEQIKKVRSLLSKHKDAYIIGYLSDIEKNKPIVKKNEEVFKRLKIIQSGKRYFIGRFV